MMNTPLHPAIVHLSLAISVIIPIVLPIILWGIWKSWWPSKTWILIVVLQTLLAGSCYLASESGEDVERPVKKIVASEFIHEHEEMAEKFSYIAYVTLGMSVLGLFVYKPKTAVITIRSLTALGAISALVTGLLTGKRGGELVYVHGAAEAFYQKNLESHLGSPAEAKDPSQQDMTGSPQNSGAGGPSDGGADPNNNIDHD